MHSWCGMLASWVAQHTTVCLDLKCLSTVRDFSQSYVLIPSYLLFQYFLLLGSLVHFWITNFLNMLVINIQYYCTVWPRKSCYIIISIVSADFGTWAGMLPTNQFRYFKIVANATVRKLERGKCYSV